MSCQLRSNLKHSSTSSWKSRITTCANEGGSGEQDQQFTAVFKKLMKYCSPASVRQEAHSPEMHRNICISRTVAAIHTCCVHLCMRAYAACVCLSACRYMQHVYVCSCIRAYVICVCVFVHAGVFVRESCLRAEKWQETPVQLSMRVCAPALAATQRQEMGV